MEKRGVFYEVRTEFLNNFLFRRAFIIIIGMTALYGPQPSLDFLTTGFLQGGAVNPTPNHQHGGPGRQGDPAIPLGAGYPF
jgi:hypothetical protein